MNILVVDDYKPYRDEVARMLVKNGHQVDTAESADTGLVLAERGRYDFVLVDFCMPGHDGVWFMRHANLPNGTKALLATGHARGDVVRRMFSLGAAGYLEKPFNEADLMTQLAYHSQSDQAWWFRK